MLSFHCSATINRRNTRISSESFSPPLSNAIKHYLTTRVSLSLSTHQAPVHTYVHVCTRVRKVENRAGGCEVEWRHAFDVPSSSWARGSLSLSILSPGDLCNDEASKRTFNACESTMARRCISYPLRASINEFYYPRVGVLEKIRFAR